MPAIAIPVLASALALASPSAEPGPVEGFGQAVSVPALEALRGGESTIITVVDVDNQGQVDGNTAVGTVGGPNTVTGGAFGNAAGINTVIQNSGANVLIQNGTAVNVQFGGPGP
ncbi:hypothetical protein [Luteimonas terricola]|uniref:Curli production assembly/transport component CsgF n=1 Tax=Luteimonas terricola TaxID=645597 RepID=A0ABQ2EJ96_9GAMM|nr:hypothetical protein [Luteimonas terricola]GGK09587.1 hypothetical protein GCM10011394_18770 [Luteimonas terricola]